MINKIHHVGIVVRNLDDTMALYNKMLGTEPESQLEIAEIKAKIANYRIGKESMIEVIQAGPGDHLADFLESNGEGIHHIAFEVDDIEAELKKMAEMGIDLIDKEPRQALDSKIAFMGPSKTHGVLIELVQSNA